MSHYQCIHPSELSIYSFSANELMGRNSSILLVLLILAQLFLASAKAESEEYFYDPLGQLIGMQDGSDNVTLYSYDPAGTLLKVQRFPQGLGVGV